MGTCKNPTEMHAAERLKKKSQEKVKIVPIKK
jgi:hypothetical protein